MSNDEDIELAGDSELFDLLLEAQTKACEVADRLGLSNEDLKKIEARWEAIGLRSPGSSEGHAMVSLAHHVLIIRRVQLLAAMMKPDETIVPLVELADRFDKSNGGDS
jgi:hypothetical protein